MNRSSGKLLAEILFATAFAALNAFACVWLSVWGGKVFKELHLPVEDLPLARAALSGYLWGPAIIIGALIAFLPGSHRIDRQWPVWAFVLVVSAVPALIGFAIVDPFSRVDFSLSS